MKKSCLLVIVNLALALSAVEKPAIADQEIHWKSGEALQSSLENLLLTGPFHAISQSFPPKNKRPLQLYMTQMITIVAEKAIEDSSEPLSPTIRLQRGWQALDEVVAESDSILMHSIPQPIQRTWSAEWAVWSSENLERASAIISQLKRGR